MPIYEFYCSECHTIFSFFFQIRRHHHLSRMPEMQGPAADAPGVPVCIHGEKPRRKGEMDDLPIDDAQMAQAMEVLAKEADKIDENDPKQAAGLMRKLSGMTGLQLGHGMEEALARMERGEDPEAIESEMGDLLETEEPFLLPGKKKMSASGRMAAPCRDETLYDLKTE